MVVPKNYSRDAAADQGDNAATAMKSVVVDPRAYDWEGDTPLNRPSSRTIIYEMHVRGFTRHPSSGVAEESRGTYAGLIEKIPYLQELGITAVELLPVFQFDAQDAPPGRVNYWGYAPVSFFAPHQRYSSRQDPLGPVDEFRDMVKALHRAGIEVILDVVFNHTAEGDHRGPTLEFPRTVTTAPTTSWSRTARATPTTAARATRSTPIIPIVRRMILDSLRYWVEEMHVDGFRFDLASILARGFVRPVDAEPAGALGYRVGPGAGGHEAHRRGLGCGRPVPGGQLRRATVGRSGTAGFATTSAASSAARRARSTRLADRFLGSPEIYGHKEREAEQSVNFVTCHDGFTLNDLVSYNQKHNEANGEDNRDGANDNRSWNCGVEGPTDDPAVEKLRNRQVKNFLTVTMLSLGMPMIVMGDEVRRTQRGNNNAYCQDNETSWFDWTLVEKHADVHRFVRLLIARRLLRDMEAELQRLGLNQLLREGKLTWHGVRVGQPDWSNYSHSLALGGRCEAKTALSHDS